MSNHCRHLASGQVTRNIWDYLAEVDTGTTLFSISLSMGMMHTFIRSVPYLVSVIFLLPNLVTTLNAVPHGTHDQAQASMTATMVGHFCLLCLLGHSAHIVEHVSIPHIS